MSIEFEGRIYCKCGWAYLVLKSEIISDSQGSRRSRIFSKDFVCTSCGELLVAFKAPEDPADVEPIADLCLV